MVQSASPSLSLGVSECCPMRPPLGSDPCLRRTPCLACVCLCVCERCSSPHSWRKWSGAASESQQSVMPGPPPGLGLQIDAPEPGCFPGFGGTEVSRASYRFPFSPGPLSGTRRP